MTEKERFEDDVLKNCIQEAYGYSDDQILAELDEIEESLSDDEFPGLEERMYGKLMERMGAESESEEDSEKKKEENSASVVRFGKRKVLAIGILAAAFIGVLGGTAIGDRSYFLKSRNSETGIILNNEKNVSASGDLVQAYEYIKKEFGGDCLALYGLPNEITFVALEHSLSKETLIFDYLGNKIYFVQIKKNKTSSISVQLDSHSFGTVHNKWLNMNLTYTENKIAEGNIEYESKGLIDEISYWIHGKMSKEEFENILKNINFY